MAVWEVKVVYQNGDRFWDNTWHVNIGSDTDVAGGLLDALVTFSRDQLLDLYSVARIVRRPKGSHDAFIELAVDLAGTIGSSGSKALPLFNVMKLVLGGEAGRFGAKLLRGGLLASHIIDDQDHIDPTRVSFLESDAITLFNAASTAAQSFVYGADDKVAVSPTALNSIFMRQLHRKRKKKLV